MFPNTLKSICSGIVILCVAVLNPAVAKPLHIQITGGHNIGIPIAVLPFKVVDQQGKVITNFKVNESTVVASNKKFADITNIAAVIRSDLHNSGQFHASLPEQLQRIPSDISEVNFNYWKQKKVENIIIGKIVARDDNYFDISFQLIDLYKDKTSPMYHVKYDKHLPENFRRLGHFMSDQIFKKLTGINGFFSTRIAYITLDRYKGKTIHTLTVADADGHNDKPLVSATYPLMSPKWSADGQKLAFVSFRGHRASIEIVNTITGKISKLCEYPGINGAPAWSHDGKSMALVLSKDGAPKIYVMDLDSKKIKRITHGGAIDTEPHWHVNGEEIYFTSDRGGKPQIYTVNVKNGKVDRVTYKGDYNTTPSLTPDGKNLVMLHRSGKGGYNIAIQNLKTGRVKTLTSANLDESPTIAPNGMMVLYGINEGDQNILGAVTLDGRFKMRLPVQDGNVKEPAWSPFLL